MRQSHNLNTWIFPTLHNKKKSPFLIEKRITTISLVSVARGGHDPSTSGL